MVKTKCVPFDYVKGYGFHRVEKAYFTQDGVFIKAVSFCGYDYNDKKSLNADGSAVEYVTSPCVVCENNIKRKKQYHTIHATCNIPAADLTNRFNIYSHSHKFFDDDKVAVSNSKTFHYGAKINVIESRGYSKVGELSIQIQRDPKTGRLFADFTGDLLQDLEIRRDGVPFED